MVLVVVVAIWLSGLAWWVVVVVVLQSSFLWQQKLLGLSSTRSAVVLLKSPYLSS